MPDITMCRSKTCPDKENCYRHEAKPDEFIQSYFMDDPMLTVSEGNNCSYYWPLKEDKEIEKLMPELF